MTEHFINIFLNLFFILSDLKRYESANLSSSIRLWTAEAKE
jgi:hypothetical protein